MQEIITLLSCISPILKKNSKAISNNHPSTLINARKNYNVRIK